MVISVEKLELQFNKPSGTSRGVLHKKPSWILKLIDSTGNFGYGEFSVIPGLSIDFLDQNSYETELKKVDSKKTLELFNQAKELKGLNFNEPENMYSFIEINTKEKTNRIVWAYGSTTADKKLIELYNELLITTK